MRKKRGPFTSKTAQITIYIIIGMLILFAFGFLIKMTADVKKGQLESARESAVGKLFKKEAMRLYVEDCLVDFLKEGLILLGKQGTIWETDPGGETPFIYDETGTTHLGENVVFAITREKYPNDPFTYPCNEEGFCNYRYPNTKVDFGELRLRSGTLEDDLERYLSDRTIACLEAYTDEEIAGNVELEVGDMNLGLQMDNDGIGVDALLDLKFLLGEEELFHLSKFDFYYPTKFKRLVDAAVVFPIQADHQFVDFEYTKDQLEQASFSYGNEKLKTVNDAAVCEVVEDEDYFSCPRSLRLDDYQDLSIEMDTIPLPNGDKIFAFTSPEIMDVPYTFQIARQNRPPALDYINRSACPAYYDYLVIKGDPPQSEGGHGDIDITLSARDPDEDVPTVVFDSEESSDSLNLVEGMTALVVTKEGLADSTTLVPNPEPYTFKAIATDSFGATDEQVTRILIDRPLDIEVKIDLPYEIMYEGELIPYAEYVQERGVYPVSIEDPAFIYLSIPEDSVAGDSAEREVLLTYGDPEAPEFRETYQTDSLRPAKCISLPSDLELRDECDLPGSLQKDIERLTGHPGMAFQEVGPTKKLNISYGVHYCAVQGDDVHSETSESIVDVQVQECIPHVNEARPFPYPYHEWLKLTIDTGSERVDSYTETSGSIDPFLATHACCQGGTLLGPETDCFVNPTKGCKGPIEDFDEFLPGYVLTEQFATCDVGRGNICGPEKYRLIKNDRGSELLKCGSDAPGNQCTVPSDGKCANALAFEIKHGEGWCHGRMGCEHFCEDPDVLIFTGATIELRSFTLTHLNELALQERINHEDNEDFPVQCGSCSESINFGKPCDTGFDGYFEGFCGSSSCEPT